MFISIESRLRRVDVLLNHLTEVINEKDKIVGRLQSRAAENSLKIEAPFQKYAYSVNFSPSTISYLVQWVKLINLL